MQQREFDLSVISQIVDANERPVPVADLEAEERARREWHSIDNPFWFSGEPDFSIDIFEGR